MGLPPTIGHFQTAGAVDGRITEDNQAHDGPTLKNSSRNWKTRLVGWVKNLPVIRNIETVRQERVNMESENQKVMQSFMKALHFEFGDKIGSMSGAALDESGRTPLTSRTVRATIEAASGMRANRRSMNNINVRRFLESPMAGGIRARGEIDMNGLLLDKGVKLNYTGWQRTFPDAKVHIKTAIQTAVEAHSDYSTRPINNSEIARIASRVFDDLHGAD